jgi:hypothetical protein
MLRRKFVTESFLNESSYYTNCLRIALSWGSADYLLDKEYALIVYILNCPNLLTSKRFRYRTCKQIIVQHVFPNDKLTLSQFLNRVDEFELTKVETVHHMWIYHILIKAVNCKHFIKLRRGGMFFWRVEGSYCRKGEYFGCAGDIIDLIRLEYGPYCVMLRWSPTPFVLSWLDPNARVHKIVSVFDQHAELDVAGFSRFYSIQDQHVFLRPACVIDFPTTHILSD